MNELSESKQLAATNAAVRVGILRTMNKGKLQYSIAPMDLAKRMLRWSALSAAVLAWFIGVARAEVHIAVVARFLWPARQHYR